MKKKCKKAMYGMLICLPVVLGYLYVQPKSVQLNDLVFANVEALASGEDSGNIMCFNSGDVDCRGQKVGYKFEGLR